MNEYNNSDEEFIEEIVCSIEEIGGEVTVVDIENNIFKLTIEPELQEHAKLLINDILKKYKKIKKRQIERNPFIRIERLIKKLRK
jgi:hypothetical protein